MRIARSVADATGFGPAAVTIGNFDGVHAGHQYLIRQVRDAAAKIGAKSAVLTFDPHPACVVAPDRAPRLITTLEARCALIEGQGIDEIFVLPFTREVAKLTPEEFARDFLRAMGARIVMVGENFRFGHKQSGDTAALAELGARYGFETRVVEPLKCRGRVVSSSEVRKAVDAGDATLAWRLLGRPYSVAGEVVSGRGVGSKQTVPTLNLKTDAQLIPRTGVYVTRTRDRDAGREWRSITDVGYRPTFAEETNPPLTIETFLLEPLAGEAPSHIEVSLLHFVRDERRFENPEALRAQIMRDVGRANAFFRHESRSGKRVHGAN